MFSDSLFSSIFPEFFFLTCLHTANCHCCNKTCFLGCFFPPLKHNFNRRELIFVERAFQKWDFSFLSGCSSGGKRMSNDAAVTRQLNVLFVVSTEEGGGGQIGKKNPKQSRITMTNILLRN